MQVCEMYIIESGMVGIGYSKLNIDEMVDEYLDKLPFLIALRRSGSQVVCDHYVLSGKRSNFTYMALSEVESFCLRAHYLQSVFEQRFKYGEYRNFLSSLCFYHYNTSIYKPIIRHRDKYVKELNNKTNQVISLR